MTCLKSENSQNLNLYPSIYRRRIGDRVDLSGRLDTPKLEGVIFVTNGCLCPFPWTQEMGLVKGFASN